MSIEVQISAQIFNQAVELIRQNQEDEGCRILLDHLGQATGRDVGLPEVASILESNGFRDESLQILRHAHERDSDDVEVLMLLVRALIRVDGWLELLPLAEKLNDLQPNSSEWYGTLSYAYLAAGQPQKCREIISSGLKHAEKGMDFQAGIRPELSSSARTRITLARMNEASELIAALRGLYGGPAVLTWRPDLAGDTTARLSGATRNLPKGLKPFFEVTPDEPDGVSPIRADALARSGNEGPGAPVTVWSAEVNNLVPGQSYRAELKTGGEDGENTGPSVAFTTGKREPAEIGDTRATWVGVKGAVLAGTIGGTTLPTKYHFVYGDAKDRLDRRTADKWVPPGRSNLIRQQAVDALREWLIYAVEWEIVGDDGDPESPDAFALRLISPFGKDRNHLAGMGVADLFLGWFGRFLAPDDATDTDHSISVDLRDAEVELVVRPKGLDAKDFYISCAAPSSTGERSTPNMMDAAPWTVTDQLVDPGTLDEEGWNRLGFVLRSDPFGWTFSGNNPDEQPNASRYAYLPIDDVLSNHRGNIVFWFVLGDWREPPEGTLDLRSIGLRFRNWSILSPDAGAELTGFPGGSLSDPLCLTSGCIDDPREMWFSAPGPETPQEFTWRLRTDASPTAVKLHQNVPRPAKTVEVLTSGDGRAFTSRWRGDLSQTKPAADLPPPAVIPLDGRPASHLKLVIHSGYQDDFWGLDGIEAFDDGARPIPELAPASVSEDVGDLEPGQKLHFQLVTENGAGGSQGPVRAIDIPRTPKPVITGGKCVKQTATRTTLFLEVMPSGLDTVLSGRVTDPKGETWTGPRQAVGRNPSLRHVVFAVECPGLAGAYRAEITAANEAGESKPFILEWDGVEPI